MFPRTTRGRFALWVVVTAALLGVLATDLLGLRTTPDVGTGLRRLAELLLVGGVVAIALRGRAQRVRRPDRWTAAAACLMAVVVAAQFLPDRTDLHPFVPWDMYTRATERVPWTTWWAVDATGAAQELRGAGLPTPVRPFLARLDPHVRGAADGSAEDLAIVGATAAELVALAGLDDSTAVEIRRCEVTTPTAARPAYCTTWLTVPLGVQDPS